MDRRELHAEFLARNLERKSPLGRPRCRRIIIFKLSTCNRETIHSNLGRDTGYTD
jgi:hypothetical protein